MSVLFFAENIEGKFHKPVFEALTYATDVAAKLNTNVVALSLGTVDGEELKKLSGYGANKVLNAGDALFNAFNSAVFAAAMQQAIDKEGADVVIMSSTFNAKSLAPRLSAKISAGLVTNAIELPDTNNGFAIKKPVYSGKGFGLFRISTDKKIITVAINSYHVTSGKNGNAAVEDFAPQIDGSLNNIKVTETKREKGKISLPEAEIVVSGGRGMKGPENWGPIEELADILGAATACSKPVADVGWRPHSEHVGQTGLTISPDLYIAIGISGAIQHLAGVSGSKVIVVVNKDPEAPFFKAANYGIVGDAFEVLPKLIEAAKKIKAHA